MMVRQLIEALQELDRPDWALRTQEDKKRRGEYICDVKESNIYGELTIFLHPTREG